MGIIKKILGLHHRIVWKSTEKKLMYVGKNCRVGRNFSIREPEYISIGDNFEAGDNISIHAWKRYKNTVSEKNPNIVIGNDVSMTQGCYISCLDEIIIGDGTLIGVNTFISDNAHGNTKQELLDIPPNRRTLYSKGPVRIGKNVWIGRNVCIMSDVTVGDGAIIGANAVVTHDVPARAVVAGVPAHIIKLCEEENKR